MTTATKIRPYAQCNLSLKPEIKQKLVEAASARGMTITSYVVHLAELSELLDSRILEMKNA